MRSAALMVGLGLFAAGCSVVLDTSKTGLPCDQNGNCLAGYVCDAATNTCQPAKTGPCQPACGPGAKCEQEKCVASCDADPSVEKSGKWPCAAGQFCSNGQCVAQQNTGKLGDACSQDSDCTGDALAFCLRPVGGGSSMCTKVCANDSDCQVESAAGGGDAPKCTAYPDGNGQTLTVCAPATFVPCHQESDCAQAGLSCGLYVVDKPVNQADTLLACRERMNGGKSIGDKTCSPAAPCQNGLCEQIDNVHDWECLTPCQADADCQKTMPASPQPTCTSIAVVDPASSSTPVLRAPVCIPGESHVGGTCTGSTPSCAADAPNCVAKTGGTDVCAPLCAAGAQPCPQSLSCQGQYCE